MKTHLKSFYIFVFAAFVLFSSCKKEKNSLYSISISPNAMVGTPAEVFSIGQIKMFQASNNFISLLIADIAQDTSIHNFAIAPTYLLNNLLIDSTLLSWQESFIKHYSLTSLSQTQRKKTENDFLNAVKDIDSSIIINSDIVFENDETIKISQSFEKILMYEDNAPNDIDNIFTTSENKKTRLDFITISSDIRTYITDMEQTIELPIGNGNYMLMLIRPLNQSLRQYAKNFTEEKYFSLINNMQERKINVSFPLINIKDSTIIPLPSYHDNDTTVTFPKTLSILYSFSLQKASQADLNTAVTHNRNKNILSNNTSEPIKFSSPFLFIIRGKSSNWIMFCGAFCKPLE